MELKPAEITDIGLAEEVTGLYGDEELQESNRKSHFPSGVPRPPTSYIGYILSAGPYTFFSHKIANSITASVVKTVSTFSKCSTNALAVPTSSVQPVIFTFLLIYIPNL